MRHGGFGTHVCQAGMAAPVCKNHGVQNGDFLCDWHFTWLSGPPNLSTDDTPNRGLDEVFEFDMGVAVSSQTCALRIAKLNKSAANRRQEPYDEA
jgi:hypothetical protein